MSKPNQNIKTNYTPTNPSYSQGIPSGQQNQRDIRKHAREKQIAQSSMSGQIGAFLGRGVSNFKANMRRPYFAEDTPRKAPPKGAHRGRPPVGINYGGGVPMMGGFGGGLDLSMHPDPMVSGMYRREPPAEKQKKRKSGSGTEIHYHYHY